MKQGPFQRYELLGSDILVTKGEKSLNIFQRSEAKLYFYEAGQSGIDTKLSGSRSTRNDAKGETNFSTETPPRVQRKFSVGLRHKSRY